MTLPVVAQVITLKPSNHVDVPEERAWLTAMEAVAEALPGLPASKRHMNRLLSETGVKCRKRTARGGGREFHWTSLPREAAAEYLRRYGVSAETLATRSPTARASEKDARAETRKKIVDAADAYVARSKRTKGKALAAFAELYRARRVRGMEAIDYELERTATPAQVREWARVIRLRGAGALIDGRGRPKGTGFFKKEENRPIAQRVIALSTNPRFSAKDICQKLEEEDGVTIALRTMQAFLSEFRTTNKAAYTALINPDRARSHFKPAFGSRSSHVTVINQVWELDATRADVACRMADGSLRRMALTAVIDVYTRRAMVLVSDEPSGMATQALLRRAIVAWGVPHSLKTDNGKEFSNRAVRLFCEAAGIELVFSRPFHPEEKPHVERFFGTLNNTFLPLMQGYVGANVAERQAIRSQVSFQHRFGDDAVLVHGEPVSPEGLQARIDAWCRDEYEQRPHDGLKHTGGSPANMALIAADQVRRLPDERALDHLLMPLAGSRRVLKKGIALNRRWYIAPELGAVMNAEVSVRHDPYDLSRIFVYRADNDAFLCVAVDPTTISSREQARIAVEGGRAWDKANRERREAIRKVHRLYPEGSEADRRLKHLQGDGFALLPDAAEGMQAAETRKMIAAGRAAEAADRHGKPEQPIEPTAEERASYEAVMAEVAPPLPPDGIEQCDGYQRPKFIDDDFGFYAWALSHVAGGNALDAFDQRVFDGLKADMGFQQLFKQRGMAS